jgi:hypothetical protein
MQTETQHKVAKYKTAVKARRINGKVREANKLAQAIKAYENGRITSTYLYSYFSQISQIAR